MHAYQQAVPQHRDAVGDLERLVDEVRDEEDRHPLRLQSPDHGEQHPHLVFREAGSGLVEDQDPRPGRERPGDGAHLLHGDRVRGERRHDVHAHVQVGEKRLGLAAQAAPADPERVRSVAPEADVLGDRQVRAEIDLLVDGADAQPLRVERARRLDLVSLEEDAAGVGGVDSSQDLDQGRLPGPVLPHDGMDFAGEQAEVDFRERLDAREALRDALHLEHRDGFAHHVSSAEEERPRRPAPPPRSSRSRAVSTAGSGTPSQRPPARRRPPR